MALDWLKDLKDLIGDPNDISFWKRMTAILAGIIFVAGIGGGIWISALKDHIDRSKYDIDRSKEYREERDKLKEENRKLEDELKPLRDIIFGDNELGVALTRFDTKYEGGKDDALRFVSLLKNTIVQSDKYLELTHKPLIKTIEQLALSEPDKAEEKGRKLRAKGVVGGLLTKPTPEAKRLHLSPWFAFIGSFDCRPYLKRQFIDLEEEAYVKINEDIAEVIIEKMATLAHAAAFSWNCKNELTFPISEFSMFSCGFLVHPL